MDNLKFFNHFKKKLSALEHQTMSLLSVEDMAHLLQMSSQLQSDLGKYKQLMNDSFELLWEKRNQYNQLLADNINSGFLSSEEYKQATKKFKRLDCDIEALDKLLKQETPQEKIELYETKLGAINDRICDMKQKVTLTK